VYVGFLTMGTRGSYVEIWMRQILTAEFFPADQFTLRLSRLRKKMAMNLSVKGKQLDVGDSLKSHVADTLHGVVEKYFSRSIEANIVFSKDAYLYTADIQVHVGRGILLQSTAQSNDPYGAFDEACEKIAKRLRRYKRRLRDHHGRSDAEMAGEAQWATQYILGPEQEDEPDSLPALEQGSTGVGEDAARPLNGEENPVVVAEMPTAIDTLTVGEAVMRLELAELPALMFRNRAHGEINMVYRRSDGHVGWVDPKGVDQAAA